MTPRTRPAGPTEPARRVHGRLLVGWLAGLAAAGSGGRAVAGDYPDRPVQLAMQYPAGSGPDALLRRVGEALARRWGRPLVVVNKPGANGWLAAAEVKQAAPDGYTLLVTDNTGAALQPLLFRNMPFDPVRDFDPVMPLYSTHFFIVVAHGSPWRGVADLLQAAQAMKGELTVGSFGTGGVNQVGIAAFEDATATKLTLVPYKTLPDMCNDVAAGRVGWAFATAATAAPYLQGKRLRLLAIAAPKRAPAFADVPTVAESGGPAGFELKTWVAVYAPRGTPASVADRLRDDLRQALDDEAAVAYLATSGFERWSGSAADVVAATTADRERFAALVKRINLQPN